MFRFILIVGSILVTLDLLWWWRGDAWARRLEKHRAWRIGWATFMIVQTVGILLLLFARYLGLDRTAGLPLPMLTFLFVWHLLVLPGVIVIALLGGTGWSIAQLVKRIGHRAKPQPTTEPAPTRRQFLTAAAVAVPPLVTMIGTARAVPQINDFRIRRMTLDLASLPRDLDGFTIAHVADVHVGDYRRNESLEA
jgi:hypothetical protein